MALFAVHKRPFLLARQMRIRRGDANSGDFLASLGVAGHAGDSEDLQRYGMTWKLREPRNGCIFATCNDDTGLEGAEYEPQPGYNKCNAYDGDTPCSKCRPRICVRNL